MTIADMIPGNRYWVGDGYGYSEVLCIGSLSEKEFEEHYSGAGTYVKVLYVKENKEDIYFEAVGYEGRHLYVEDMYND